MEINNDEEYDIAKKRFSELFHADVCQTNYDESQELMSALDEYGSKLKTKIDNDLS